MMMMMITALAPYPWSHGISWCLAGGTETEITAAPYASLAWEGLYWCQLPEVCLK